MAHGYPAELPWLTTTACDRVPGAGADGERRESIHDAGSTAGEITK